MNIRLIVAAGLALLAGCSEEVAGKAVVPRAAEATDGLDGHAAMERSDFVRAIEGQMAEFERSFRMLESRVVLAGDKAGAEVQAAVAELPRLRDVVTTEFTRFKDAAEAATTAQRKELVEFVRRLHRALRDAVAKEN